MTGDDVALDDGLFEVMLIRTPRNAVELNEIIAALTKLRPESDLIYTFKTEELQIEPYQAIPWTLDGEYGGHHQNWCCGGSWRFDDDPIRCDFPAEPELYC